MHRNDPFHTVVIRQATPDDTTALSRLAALDSAPVPAGTVLIAEADGELVAALGEHGHSVADPFKPSLRLVDLLRLRAA